MISQENLNGAPNTGHFFVGGRNVLIKVATFAERLIYPKNVSRITMYDSGQNRMLSLCTGWSVSCTFSVCPSKVVFEIVF